MTAPVRISVSSPEDVARARRAARSLAQALGFGLTATEKVVLATMELGTNLVRYAPGGALTLSASTGPRGTGVQIESCDRGPGIADLGQAMEDGFSTGGGLGSGLPGVRRLMDDFEIRSGARGTIVVARKWPPHR